MKHCLLLISAGTLEAPETQRVTIEPLDLIPHKVSIVLVNIGQLLTEGQTIY